MNEQQVREILTKSCPDMCVVIERVTAQLNEIIQGSPYMLRCKYLADSSSLINGEKKTFVLVSELSLKNDSLYILL